MKRYTRVYVAVLAAAATLMAGEPSSPTWRGDTSFAGFTKDAVPENPTKVWEFPSEAPVTYAPVVGDGMVFVVNARSKIFALDIKKGLPVWSKTVALPSLESNAPPQSMTVSAPPAYAFGTLLLVSSDGALVALGGKDGQEKWRSSAGSPIQASPNIADMGKDGWLAIVLAQENGVFTAFEGATGTQKWQSDSFGRIDGHFAVSAGRIAFGGCDATVHTLSAAEGTETLAVSLGEGSEIAGGVAIAGSMVYSGSRSGALCAVDTEKKSLKWRYGGGAGELFSTPAATEKVVVFSAGSGAVTAIDTADPSKAKWEYDAGGMSAQSPIIAGDRVVAVIDGKIRILDLNDGKKVLWTSPAIGDGATAPAVTGGMIIVGTDAGSVVAFGAKEGESK